MIQTRSYYDLCIQESFFTEHNLDENIKMVYDYGYRTIAVNQIIDGENVEHKKKKKKGVQREIQDIVPQPFDLSSIKNSIQKQGIENLNILNRLTISFASQDALYKITKSPNYKKYHIIAAAPTTWQAFSFTCSSFEADIFTFNPENKFDLRLNRKLYRQLLDRGYHFELLYASAIESSVKRKNLIHASHLFHSVGKSRNIAISSGARSLEFLRSPYDIINLGYIFGLSELQSKTAVTHSPSNIIINSIGRRHGKAVMLVENVGEQLESTKINEESVVISKEDSDEEMESDQPRLKKTKCDTTENIPIE